MREPKIGLALSGGAALGAAHVGALQSLTAHKIPLSYITGTSAGAIVGAFHAFGIPEEKTIEHIANMSWRSVGRLSFSKYGLLSNDALGNILHDALGDPRIEDAHIPLSILAVDITTGEPIVFREGPLIPPLLASSCIPGIFAPVTIDGRMLVDGGLINNFPLSELDVHGMDIRVGVNVIPNTPTHPPANWFDIVNRSFDIISHNRYSDVRKGDIIIRPDLAEFSYSSLSQAPRMIAEGRRATDQQINSIREAVDTFNNVEEPTIERTPTFLERIQALTKKLF